MLFIPRDRALSDRREGAFTLIEVLVSVAILSVGMVMVLQALQRSIVFLGDARDCVWANRIVSEKIEETRLSALRSKGPLSPCSLSGHYQVYFGDFLWESRISSGVFADLPGNTGMPEPRMVTVSAWREGGGRRYSCSAYIRSVQLETEGPK
jgi:prepilin-type N-terminal cleavage/methylation domain-containing protein